MKYNLTATFSNGKTIQRTSKSNFQFAWFAQNIYQSHSGFASTKEQAAKSARGAFHGCPPAHTIEIVATAQIA